MQEKISVPTKKACVVTLSFGISVAEDLCVYPGINTQWLQ